MLNIGSIINSVLTNINSMLNIASFWDDVLVFLKKVALDVSTGLLQACKAMFQLIFDLSKMAIFTEGAIDQLLSRVYIILSVVMLFKIVISCIQFLINPDKIDDKKEGFGAIFQRLFIALALLALIKPIFQFAIRAQNIIIQQLPTIIMGQQTGTNTTTMDANGNVMVETSTTEQIVLNTELSFIRANEDCTENKDRGIIDVLEKDTLKTSVTSIGQIFNNRHIILGAKCGGADSGKFKYEYTGLLHVISSLFLLYMLIVMSFEVAIRAIKFGFLEFIAPIPIASYVDPKSSQKMFSAWVKTSVSVYLDLFIRISVVYFILFLFRTLLLDDHGILSAGYVLIDGQQVTGVRAAFARIAIILGIFMFAKDFPKFIGEALGLDKMGKLGNMFKPNRITGLAGGVAGMAGNAIANYRQAKKAGAKGGERFARAFAGLSRGGLDAVVGLAGGEGWKKMSERHMKAISKSKARAVRAAKKRGNEESNDKKKKAYKNRLASFFGDENFDVNSKEMQRDATNNYNNRLAEIDKRKAALAERLNKHKYKSADERQADVKEYQNLVNEQKSMQEVDDKGKEVGKETWIEKEKYRLAAEQSQQREFDQDKTRFNKNKTRIDQIDKEIRGGVTAERRAELEMERLQCVKDNEELQDKHDKYKDPVERKKHLDEREKAIRDTYKNLDQIKEEESMEIPGATRSAVATYLGGTGTLSKGYSDLSEMLGKHRSAIYTGEAMTKLRQNADILIDADTGQECTFTTKFKNDNKGISYSQMASLQAMIKNSQITEADLKSKYGFENFAMFQSAFEDIEKKAAAAYVDANIAEISPTIRENPKIKFRLKRPEDVNTTITEWWDRMMAEMSGLGVPPAELKRLMDDLANDPGEFIKRGSELKERYATRATRILDAEKPSSGNK